MAIEDVRLPTAQQTLYTRRFSLWPTIGRGISTLGTSLFVPTIGGVATGLARQDKPPLRRVRAPDTLPSMPQKLADLYSRAIETAAVQTPITIPPCQVCRGEKAQPAFDIEHLKTKLLICAGCGLGLLHPQPSAEEIDSFYPPDYYGESGNKFEPLVEALVRLVADRHARFWTRGLPAGGRVLDLGCGRGVLLKAFLDRGFEGHGVEFSASALQGIDSRALVRIEQNLRKCNFPANHFDQIMIWHVLEHLPDPREVLLECHRILKPGGRVVIAVPNFSSLQARWAGPAWFHLDLPRHLFHFPVMALQRLLADCGFDSTSQNHFSQRQNTFGWVQSALNRFRWLPRNGLYTLLQSHSGSAIRRPTRCLLRLAYWLGMPPALALSVLTAGSHSGATVTVVAHAKASPIWEGSLPDRRS